MTMNDVELIVRLTRRVAELEVLLEGDAEELETATAKAVGAGGEVAALLRAIGYNGDSCNILSSLATIRDGGGFSWAPLPHPERPDD